MTAQCPPAARSGPRRGGIFLLLMLAGGAAGAWWWFRPVPAEPPLPPDIQDAEVRGAVERMRQEVSEDPRSGAAWGNLGMVLLAHLFEREADLAFAEAARLDPSEPLWPYGRAILVSRSDPERAIPFLRQALAAGKGGPLEGPMRLQLAEALLERHEVDEAERLFRVEEPGPSNPRAALGLGRALVARGKGREAVTAFEAARKNPSSRKQATSELAALARARGDATASAYEKVAAALPNDRVWPDPLLDRTVRLQVGREGRERRAARLELEHLYAEALQEWLADIEIRPTAKAHVGAGLDLARLKEYQRALHHLREAVRLEPDSADAHYSLALTLFSMGEREWLKAPGADHARRWLAEAVGHGRRAAELKPDHARAYLFWGASLKFLGKTAEAVPVLRKGVACRPEDIDLQFTLGEALLETGQTPEAKTHLENARSLAPKDPRPGQVLELLGRRKE